MAAVDYFLKIDGVRGESTDSKHKDEIEIDSFSWGVSQAGTFAFGGGAGAGKVSFKDFHFTTRVNRSSPTLMLKCANGQHIKQAVLTARKSSSEGGGEEFLKVTLSDVLVSSYQNAGTATPRSNDNPPGDVEILSNALVLATDDAGLPGDSVSLRYAALKFVEGPQTHIDVRPAATGVFAFDTATGDWTLTEGGEGGLGVGTQDGVVHRGVVKFDVADLKGLLGAPFNTARLTFTVNEARPPSEDPDGEKSPPDPNLPFDVIMFPTSDLSLSPEDLTRAGDRIGSLHVDPRREPATLDLDLTNLVLDRILIGLRVELRGAPIDVDASDPSGAAAQRGSGDVVLKGRNILINFTTALSFDTA
jgi:type VI secretion system secreted protein Hcp